MSVHVSSDVWRHSRASGVGLLILLSLADQADDAGRCWPSVANIAERCRVSLSTVHRHLDQLVRMGEVERDRREGQSSVYVIHPCQPDTPVNLTPLSDPPPTPVNLTPTSVTGDIQKHQETREETSIELLTSEVDQTPSLLCELLRDRMVANGCKPPTITKAWVDAARLMIERDGRDPANVRRAILWATDHEFWRTNILSMPKVRQKFDQLRLQAQSEARRSKPRHQVERDDQFARMADRLGVGA